MKKASKSKYLKCGRFAMYYPINKGLLGITDHFLNDEFDEDELDEKYCCNDILDEFFDVANDLGIDVNEVKVYDFNENLTDRTYDFYNEKYN